ncbi:MAG TPA: chorismate-binding protein, partial [bacterium]|nr:chorismate-binding protein [bacterium]
VVAFGFDGNMDSAITIRSVVLKKKKAYVQAGAGLVADSVPESEYLESCNKARAVLMAVNQAEKVKGEKVERAKGIKVKGLKGGKVKKGKGARKEVRA